MITNNLRQLTMLGIVFLLLIGLPVFLFLSQNNQDNRSSAGASSSLYFTPSTTNTAPTEKQVGDTVTFDVMVNPGTNLPSVIKLQMNFDPAVLQANGASSFAVNSNSFPTILEGPYVTNNSVAISVSIGSDTTKAIQQVTKVGSLTLKVIGPTTTEPTSVIFGTQSQILSVGESDQANQNVLATTQPAFLNAQLPPTPTPIPPTATPIPPTATPTPEPTLTPTPTIEITMSPTTTPSAIPSPSPTISPNSTVLAFTLYMHGIGNSGDNVNPTEHTLSNKNPLHPSRILTVQVFNSSNQMVKSTTGGIAYDSAKGYFTGKIDLGNAFTTGQYTVKVQTLSHLRRLIPGIQTLTAQQENTMPTATLIAGDVNGDNVLNIIDYNLIVNCYSDLLPAISCDESTKLLTDLNDDGAVNQIDYNLFLREITVQSGN